MRRIARIIKRGDSDSEGYLVQSCLPTVEEWVWQFEYSYPSKQLCAEWLAAHNYAQSIDEFCYIEYGPNNDDFCKMSYSEFLSLPRVPWKETIGKRFTRMVVIPQAPYEIASGYRKFAIAIGGRYCERAEILSDGAEILYFGGLGGQGPSLPPDHSSHPFAEIQACEIDVLQGSGLVHLYVTGSKWFQLDYLPTSGLQISVRR